MKKLVLCMVVMFFLTGVREVIGGGCCQGGSGSTAGGCCATASKEISLEAALEEVRTTLWLTDAQLNTLRSILEKHGIKTGVRSCPMAGKAGGAMGGCCSEMMDKAGATGGCCAVKKEEKAAEKSSP